MFFRSIRICDLVLYFVVAHPLMIRIQCSWNCIMIQTTFFFFFFFYRGFEFFSSVFWFIIWFLRPLLLFYTWVLFNLLCEKYVIAKYSIPYPKNSHLHRASSETLRAQNAWASILLTLKVPGDDMYDTKGKIRVTLFKRPIFNAYQKWNILGKNYLEDSFTMPLFKEFMKCSRIHIDLISLIGLQ